METTCQDSYPLNSENASPFGTFTVYLSCAGMAMPPETASTNAMITITKDRIFFFMARSSVAVWKFGIRSRRELANSSKRCGQRLRLDGTLHQAGGPAALKAAATL